MHLSIFIGMRLIIYFLINTLFSQVAYSSDAKIVLLEEDEENAIFYLQNLGIRYPRKDEKPPFAQWSINLCETRASICSLLKKHADSHGGELMTLCGTAVKSYILLKYGDKIDSLEKYNAFLSSPYLAHIHPRNENAKIFISTTKTINCGQWLAWTSRGWLGLSNSGLIILDSLSWKRQLINGLKEDLKDNDDYYFNDLEKTQIYAHDLLNEDNWDLFEVYSTKSLNFNIKSKCTDDDWPDQRCKEFNTQILTGKW